MYLFIIIETCLTWIMIKKILNLLKKNKQGLSFQRIARELNLLQREKTLLRERLHVLENKGAILNAKRKYFFLPESRLVRGKLISIGRGYGFVRQDKDPSRDIFIPGRHSGGALLGDIVEVVYQEKGTGNKLEGKIVRTVKQEKKTVLGVFKERWGQPFVLPYEAPSFDEIPLKCRNVLKAEPNVIVEVDRDTWCIAKVLGKPETPGVDFRVISAKYELSDAFSAEALVEAEEISSRITPQERERRRDFRSWRTVTIDGEDARDFDDAVSIKKLKNGNLLLGVHIADVSFYVKPDSFLDRDAYLKGTSVYFPETTFPMLPERLSADICSLREGEERLAFSVLLEINKQSEVVKSNFLPSIIKSDARMTYNSVFKIFSGEQKEIYKYSSFVPDLLYMRELADRLRKKRVKEGSLDFEHPEPQLVYRGKVLSGVTSLEQNEAHRVIEVFMVAANEAVAVFLANKKAPALFRVHPPPALADLEKLRSILAHFGFSSPPSDKIKGRDLQSILERAVGRPESKFISLQVLKSLRIAVYSAENSGHFGLGKLMYTHFTSPIRRYPDLIVHRVLKKTLTESKPEKKTLSTLARYCSDRERKAMEAERDLIEWRIYRYLKTRMGDEFAGIIVDISKSGLIVELGDYFISGIIFFNDLAGDYYYRDNTCILKGKRTGKKYELGESLMVAPVAVDPDLRRMTLQIIH